MQCNVINLTSSEVQSIINPPINNSTELSNSSELRNSYEFYSLLRNRGFTKRERIEIVGDGLGAVNINYHDVPIEPEYLQELRREYTNK